MDCLGDTNTSGGNVQYDNLLYILNNALWCTVDPTSPNPVAKPLVDNVSNFKVWYGVDTTSSGSATQYLKASQIANWSNVKSVMIQWTFTIPTANQPGVQTAQNNTPIQFNQVIQLLN